jgi:thymidylate synthase
MGAEISSTHREVTVQNIYKPLAARRPDVQYRERLRATLASTDYVQDTPQDEGARTLFGELAPMVFPVSNGAPFITERDISDHWRAGIGELLGFINGATTHETLSREYGVTWWKRWVTEAKCKKIGVPAGDIGPGSYGGAFHDFPMPDGSGFNQISHLVRQLRNPDMHKRRTIFVSPWIPFYNGWGDGLQKATVSPCHGWMHFRVMEGKLRLHMFQRSADLPTGVPFNMVQYFAFLLAVAQVTGLEPAKYCHSFSDAHIYDRQVDNVHLLMKRERRAFPVLRLDPGVQKIEDFRPHHFVLEEYTPHPAMAMPTPV